MRHRLRGHSGLRVSELFLGAMTFADGFVHQAGRDEVRRIVDAYAAAGVAVLQATDRRSSGPFPWEWAAQGER
jgi:aryl-alcohol dehydrogenase-like predicted oxidoreductase